MVDGERSKKLPLVSKDIKNGVLELFIKSKRTVVFQLFATAFPVLFFH
jgi:hypothetical protein